MCVVFFLWLTLLNNKKMFYQIMQNSVILTRNILVNEYYWFIRFPTWQRPIEAPPCPWFVFSLFVIAYGAFFGLHSIFVSFDVKTTY